MRKINKLLYYVLTGLFAFVLCFMPMQNVLADKAPEPDSEQSVLDKEEPNSEQKNLDEEELDSEQKDLDEEEPDSEPDSESEPKRNLLTNEGQGPNHYTFNYLNKDGETVEVDGIKLSELMEKAQEEAVAAGEIRPCVLDDPSSGSSELFVLMDGTIHNSDFSNVSGLQIPQCKIVNLVLADNCILECHFIELLESVEDNYTTLCIYAQSDDYSTGSLEVDTSPGYTARPAIGCAESATIGEVRIYGGKINAASENGPGIGTSHIDDEHYGCVVKIYGGDIKTSSKNNAGIQGGCSSVDIYGGKIEAKSTNSSAIHSFSVMDLNGGNITAETSSTEETDYAIKAGTIKVLYYQPLAPLDYNDSVSEIWEWTFRNSVSENNIYADQYLVDPFYKCIDEEGFVLTAENIPELINNDSEAIIEPMLLGIKHQSVTLDSGKIFLNFFVYIPGTLRDYDLSETWFKYGVNVSNSLGRTETIDGNTLKTKYQIEDETGTYYTKVSVEIQSVEMADKVLFDLKLKDKYGNEWEKDEGEAFSLMQYYSDLVEVYKNEGDEEKQQQYLPALQLLRSLAEYGQEEQNFLMDYHDWKVGEWENPGHRAIEIPDGAPGTPYDVDTAKSALNAYSLTVTGSSENVIRSNISVAFESDLSMRFKVDLTEGADKKAIKNTVSVVKAGSQDEVEGVTVTTNNNGLLIIIPSMPLQDANQYYEVTVDGKMYSACPLAYANAIMDASESYEGDKKTHAQDAMAAFYEVYTKAHAWVYPDD